MSFLVCHPGRYGDLLWALPTVRALAEYHGEAARIILPADAMDGTPMEAMAPLLIQQEYIGRVDVDPTWHITSDAPRRPRFPASAQSLAMRSLGYEDWPRKPLPYEVASLAGDDIYNLAANKPEVFFRPWIEMASTMLPLRKPAILVHWTDRWFELKLGIVKEIGRLLPGVYVDWYAAKDSRMHQAGATPCTFEWLAAAMTEHSVVLTDCSAAHVLAAAVGVRTVLVMEPERDRHHFIFWPGSLVHDDGVTKHWRPMGTPLGDRIKPVLGTDGAPTFDSRHVIDEIVKVLEVP